MSTVLPFLSVPNGGGGAVLLNVGTSSSYSPVSSLNRSTKITLSLYHFSNSSGSTP